MTFIWPWLADRNSRTVGAMNQPLSLSPDRTPPQAIFAASAVFHYLGPAFAVMLFAQVAPLGVAWLRIASAAAIFALWRRPWVYWRTLAAADRLTVVALGAVLAAMNALFYLAIARLPLATVGAIEFVGPIGLAALGARSGRNLAALLLAAAGVYALTQLRLEGAMLGYAFAFGNCALFVLYIVLGHRISGPGGLDRLAAAMLVAAVIALPVGFPDARVALVDPLLLAAAVGVGVSSSVIPYVADQLAMARLPRASFALMLSILPAMAALIGFLALRQTPGWRELVGIALVMLGVALHRPARA
ncbi:MAG: Membrane protein [Caulobacter sp.]|nr:Membrane protein [Caulobacter sp.]